MFLNFANSFVLMKYFFLHIITLCSVLANAQATTHLYGTVKDEKSNAIIGASVFFENTNIGTQTDANGNYHIANIAPGSYNLVVSYIGYKSQTRYNIIVKSRGNPTYNFILKKRTEVLNEVVLSNSNRISRPKETPLSTQSLSATEIATYPGANNDVVKAAQTFAGVSPSVGGFRNDLIIRGGAPNETVYYLDGVEVPNINHFSTQGSSGGPVGLVNVSFINDVTLSTSAFAAQYDNPLSGVLQFTQRNGNNRNFNSNFRLSASEAALTFEGPLFKKKKQDSKTTFLVSVRRSYLEFLFEIIGLPIRPNYWDYQFKLNHHIDNYNTLSLTGIGAIDDFSVEAPDTFDVEQQANLDQTPFIDQRTNAIGITWKNRFKNNSGFMQTTLSNNFLRNEFTRFNDPENEVGVIFSNDALESETKLRYAITKFYGDWNIKGGFNTQYSVYENTTEDLLNNRRFSSDIDFIKYGVFINATRSFFNDKLDVSLGFRLDDDSFTDSDNLGSTFSPRASLSYEFVNNWKLNGTLGRYYRLPQYTTLGFRNNQGELVNKDIDYTVSNHFVLGLEHYFSPSANISLEGFLKQYRNFPVSIADQVSLANQGADFDILGNENVASVGRGRSYGIELQFQQKLTHNFYGIFAYTWFFSEFTGFDRDNFMPSVWDSRHLISFTGGYKLKKNWAVSARYRFAGETPFVPTNEAATLMNFPEIVLDFSRLGDENLDVFSQLDLRIDKTWNFKKIALNVFFEAQNILAQNRPQPTQFGLARSTNGTIQEPRELIAIDSDNSQVIPSLGVVVDF